MVLPTSFNINGKHSEMEFDLVQPIRVSYTILKCFGLLRLENTWYTLYKTYSYVLNFLTTFLCTLSMVIKVCIAKNPDEFTEPLFMTLTMVALMAKVINIVSLNKEAVSFLQLLKGKDFQVQNLEEMKYLKSASQNFQIVVVVYTGASFCVLIFGYTVVLIAEKPLLPYPAWYPFEYHSKSRNYWYAFAFQAIAMIVACLTNVSIDMLQCYFLRSISLIYYALRLRLASIGDNLDERLNSLVVDKMILEDILAIIRVHRFAKRLTIQCERLLSFPFFIQVLLSAFVLCFTGYRMTTIPVLESPGRFMEMLDFLFVMALQIYLPCHYGNQITFEAGKLTEALYISNWTPLPQKSRKIIYFYMEFLKQPVEVKAGKFFQIGLPTFVKTINNAYSIFAVLVRMKN